MITAKVMTVAGLIDAKTLGKALVHEHIMVDWVGAKQSGTHRYSRDEVIDVMQPYLAQVAARGYRSFVDCSPAFLGRDPVVLQRLSEATGLHIVTNTGFYKEPYIPDWAMDATAEDIAEAWIHEAFEGIDGVDVKPGFIKIAVPPGPLAPLQELIIEAAAMTSLATGLVIASHTSDDTSAKEELTLLTEMDFPMDRFIVVHADDLSPGVISHVYDLGAWIEFDSVGSRPIIDHAKLINWAIKKGYQDRLLLSHDAGWYTVGEDGGCPANIRPYTAIPDSLIPQLKSKGVLDDDLEELLFVINPTRAFYIRGGRG